MAMGPCKNPDCNSYGHPHPNCKCYDVAANSFYADGGEVEHYCSQQRPHKSDCQYFSQGGSAGSVPEGAIPIDQFQADDAPPGAIPIDQFQADDDKYSSSGQKALTAVEGAGQGFLGPAFTALEQGAAKYGIPNASPGFGGALSGGIDPTASSQGAEPIPDLSDQEIANRQASNPGIHAAGEAAGLGAGLLTGTGEAGLITKGVGAIPKIESAGKVTSSVIKGALEMGLFQGGDETTKAMLGQTNSDPSVAASQAMAHIGAAMLMGGIGGGIFGIGAAGLSKLADMKAAEKLSTFAEDFGNRWKVMHGLPVEEEGALSPEAKSWFDTFKKQQPVETQSPKSFTPPEELPNPITPGGKFADYVMKKGPEAVGEFIGEGGGSLVGGTLAGPYGAGAGFFAGRALAPFLAKAVGRPVTSMGVNAVLKTLETGAFKSIGQALKHAQNVQRGANKITNSVNSIFEAGSQKAFNEVVNPSAREKVKDYVVQGGPHQQLQNQKSVMPQQPSGFAEGGLVDMPDTVEPDVQNDPGDLGSVYPEQNMLMQAAKSRIYNYLNSQRPQPNISKLPFDHAADDSTKEHEYNKVVDLANQPLSILNKVKDGSLTPQDLKHFNSMYPELHNELSKKITEKITEAQLNNERPKFATRQGLSLFLSAAVDSSFKPQNIMAAQATFAPKQPPPQGGAGRAPKNTSKMGEISKPYQTSAQAATARQLSARA